jgi:protein-disulfide isomerase
MKTVLKSILFVSALVAVSLLVSRPAQASHLLIGSENARVQVIVYGDLQCPYSSRFMSYVDRFEADFGDKIGLSFAHYPLSFHKEAMPASLAAYCAGEQGKAASFIIDASKNFSRLSADYYKATAKKIGVVDLEAFESCLTSAEARVAVERERDDGTARGVMSTPTIFVNGEQIKGAYPYETFKEAIEKAL